MAGAELQDTRQSTWLIPLLAAFRAAFGVIWAVNAYLTWQPEFAAHYVGYLENAARGQPDWLQPWFAFWLVIVTPRAGVFIWLTRFVETLIAAGLLLGLARKWVYVVGAASVSSSGRRPEVLAVPTSSARPTWGRPSSTSSSSWR